MPAGGPGGYFSVPDLPTTNNTNSAVACFLPCSRTRRDF
ncbi:hypothetical protein SXCC_03635 [Gluconacetobacter sp. SXCC-1]|nr:hypothetical protein SXCC_03635 [Gluconacetobacter sp. SXCC-1]